MSLIYKIFKLDSNKREDIVSATSILGIIANLFIATTKVVVGILASSVAIVSEGINNATDSITSILTLLGTKLAGKHPNKEHPFGYGRVEYLTSLIISIIILFTGYEMIKTAIENIIHPEQLNVTLISIVVVLISAVVKFVLGNYTIKMGRKADSKALEALGLDCRNDSYVSTLTIVSSIVYLIFDLSIDAYVGVIISLLVLKTGYEVLKDTIDELIGRPGQEELANKLYKEIRNTEGIISAVDMILHNYGPDSYSGSVNIELDYTKTVGEVYKNIHALQLKIMHEYNVVMVFGIYAVDNENDMEMRQYIAKYVSNKEHVKSFHALYLDESENMLYLDFIVDYEIRDYDEVKREFKEYLEKKYPDLNLTLTIETEFV
ncbi:MAG: cation diffusion facilitator family transporter [Erysipelotrichaceae bacterium]|nr:cation diffusion facilitator family transporter [Erysipelotrichaceae bacterium]